MQSIIFTCHYFSESQVTSFAKKIIDLGWLNIIKKYQRRMLTPYFLAFIVYSCYSLYTSMLNEPISIKMIVRIIMYPYYHLWYIPAIILFIFYTKVAYKNAKSLVIFYILSSIITVVWYGFGNELEERYQFLKFVGDKRFYYYSSFFTLGFIISNLDININKVVSFSVVLGSTLFSLLFEGTPLINSILWYTFNTFLVIFVISGCRDIKTPKTDFIVNIGQASLPIYLWHVLPIITISCFFESKTIYYYLAVLFSMVILCLFFVVSQGKNKFIDVYFYGNEPVQKNINNPKILE
ncbi:acyltransferase family protein [Serratia fonticola]